MPGAVLHLGAAVTCGHGGQAIPTAPVPRVLVSGQPVATIAAPYAVAGCPFASPPGPCVSGFWILGALRVTAMGQPLAIQAGIATCVPNGAPLVPIAVQPRVIAT
jgi:hypothetical protein